MALMESFIAKLKGLEHSGMYNNDFFLTWEKTRDELDAVFTVADATKVATWAKANNLGEISWWALQRDVACPNNATYISENCSGSTAPAWAYARAFAS